MNQTFEEELRNAYINFFSDLIDRVFSNGSAVVMFSDDIVLEAYRDGEFIRWRHAPGSENARRVDLAKGNYI